MQNRRNTPNLKPCFMFGGMVLLCIAIGAAVSYNRFSQPGAKADFQESDINPRFKGVKPNHTDNIVNLFPDTFDYPENDYGLDLEKPLKDSTPSSPSYPANNNPSPNASGAEQYAPPGSTGARNNPQLTNDTPVWVSQLANGIVSADRAGQPDAAGVSVILEDGTSSEARGSYFNLGEDENELDAPTGSEMNDDHHNQPYDVGYGEAFNYVAASGLATNHGPSNPSQLQCWTCHANNWLECMDSGMLLQCESHVTSCQLTIRKRNSLYARVETGCKEAIACEKDKQNNFVGGWTDPTPVNQCRPGERLGPSVCRQCCHTNNCNYNLDFMDQLGWDQVLN